MTFAQVLLSVALAATFFSAGPARADRLVTDQIGREVRIPDTVERVVALQHQSLNILVQLHAGDEVTGVLSSWKKNLGPEFARFVPGIEELPTPGDLTSANVEELLRLKPDVVFIANYAPKSMIESLERAGLPAVAVSLRRDAAGEKAKLNPTMADEDAAYADGLRDGIRLIADVVERKSEGEALIERAFASRKLVEERLADIPTEKRVRAYMANPNLTTYGSGKYTGVMMERSGALNVAAATIKGYKQVSIEEVIGWNPAVIFVQARYPSLVGEILADPQWANIDAVKSKRVYLMPEYAKAWGYPQPEALALGELWMAKKLYPERFADIDVDALARDYYRTFYRAEPMESTESDAAKTAATAAKP